MHAKTADVHFELYSLREGRWVLDACFADEPEARAEVERVVRRGDVRGARLVREVHMPGMADPIVTVVIDTTEPDRPLTFRVREEPAATPGGPGAPGSVLGDVRRHDHATVPRSDPSRASPLASPWAPVLVGGLSVVVAVGVVAGVLIR
jgi:hypothetical protein